MPTSTSREAYDDCYSLLDQALEAEVGVGAAFKTRGDAFHFRVRLNAARQLDRELKTQIHTPGHPDYGRSDYDKLTFRDPYEEKGKWWVRVQKISGPQEVVELPAE